MSEAKWSKEKLNQERREKTEGSIEKPKDKGWRGNTLTTAVGKRKKNSSEKKSLKLIKRWSVYDNIKAKTEIGKNKNKLMLVGYKIGRGLKYIVVLKESVKREREKNIIYIYIKVSQ